MKTATLLGRSAAEAQVKKADLNKLSGVMEPGKIICTLDGSHYRVASKTATADGYTFRLADLQGKPVQTPADFHPVTAALARTAAWMRFVFAYNADFDLYVKEYIKEAGLPIDPKMNWAKWFQYTYPPKLSGITKDPDVVDEAIHQVIITALAKRKDLTKFDAKRLPAGAQNQPLAEQVTTYLQWLFKKRVSEAYEFIKEKLQPSQEVSMYQPADEQSEGETEHNLLDTEEHATPGGQGGVEEATDLQRLRDQFAAWLAEDETPNEIKKLLVLYDVFTANVGRKLKISDYEADWKANTGLGFDSLKPVYAKFQGYIPEFLVSAGLISADKAKARGMAQRSSLASLTLAGTEEDQWVKDNWVKCSYCSGPAGPNPYCEKCQGRGYYRDKKASTEEIPGAGEYTGDNAEVITSALETGPTSDEQIIPNQTAEAGPATEELNENSHAENGPQGSPVLDGKLKHPERPNVDAMREALDTQVEMEVGKPIEQKQEELESGVGDASKTIEVGGGKEKATIVININAAGSNCTCGHHKTYHDLKNKMCHGGTKENPCNCDGRFKKEKQALFENENATLTPYDDPCKNCQGRGCPACKGIGKNTEQEVKAASSDWVDITPQQYSKMTATSYTGGASWFKSPEFPNGWIVIHGAPVEIRNQVARGSVQGQLVKSAALTPVADSDVDIVAPTMRYLGNAVDKGGETLYQVEMEVPGVGAMPIWMPLELLTEETKAEVGGIHRAGDEDAVERTGDKEHEFNPKAAVTDHYVQIMRPQASIPGLEQGMVLALGYMGEEHRARTLQYWKEMPEAQYKQLVDRVKKQPGLVDRQRRESLYEAIKNTGGAVEVEPGTGTDEVMEMFKNCPECDHPLDLHKAPYGCEYERGDREGGEGDRGPEPAQAMGPCGCMHGLDGIKTSADDTGRMPHNPSAGGARTGPDGPIVVDEKTAAPAPAGNPALHAAPPRPAAPAVKTYGTPIGEKKDTDVISDPNAPGADETDSGTGYQQQPRRKTIMPELPNAEMIMQLNASKESAVNKKASHVDEVMEEFVDTVMGEEVKWVSGHHKGMTFVPQSFEAGNDPHFRGSYENHPQFGSIPDDMHQAWSLIEDLVNGTAVCLDPSVKSMAAEVEDALNDDAEQDEDYDYEGEDDEEVVEASVKTAEPGAAPTPAPDADNEQGEKAMLDQDYEPVGPFRGNLVKYDQEDFVALVNSKYGRAVSGQAESLLDGGDPEDQNSNALRYIMEFAQRKGETELAEYLQNYLNTIGYKMAAYTPEETADTSKMKWLPYRKEDGNLYWMDANGVEHQYHGADKQAAPNWMEGLDRDAIPVQVVGVQDGKITPNGRGFQEFPNLAAARAVFPTLDPDHNGKDFSWAMHGEIKGQPAMRFETWPAERMYSASVKPKSGTTEPKVGATMATPNEKRAALREKIAARRKERAAASKYARVKHVAAEEPQAAGEGLEQLGEAFGQLADDVQALRENLDLVDASPEAPLKDRIAARRAFAKSFRQVAEENPVMLEDAIKQVYQGLDATAVALENYAENMGLDLSAPEEVPEPVPGNDAIEEVEISAPVEEPKAEEEEKKPEENKEGSAGADAFSSDRDHDGHPKEATSGSDNFVTDRDEKGDAKMPQRIEVPRLAAAAAHAKIVAAAQEAAARHKK
jgi:hypothetical protein